MYWQGKQRAKDTTGADRWKAMQAVPVEGHVSGFDADLLKHPLTDRQGSNRHRPPGNHRKKISGAPPPVEM
jgi:hypothetical protein